MLINIFTKSSASSRTALVAAIAFIAVIGSYNWLIDPHVQYLEAAQRYAGEIDSICKKGKMVEGKLKIKQIEVNKLAKQTAATQDKVFTDATAHQFFADIELFAAQTYCTITSLNELANNADPAEKSAGIKPRHTSIALIGSYDNIIKFLTKLTDRPNKIIIVPLSISTRQDAAETLECSFTLTIFISNDVINKGADPNA